jgi:nucleotide-binding universal stress UspA family protein
VSSTEPRTQAREFSHDGPILFAYDGSEEAKAAIRQAGRQLRDGRPALVLTVWEPLGNQPFAGAPGVPPVGLEQGVEREALRVAGEGAGLARSAGFQAEPIAERGDPVWQRIIDAAEEYDAGIVVMGSHGRTGIPLVLLGSVAEATARHSARPVLIAHAPPDQASPE